MRFDCVAEQTFFPTKWTGLISLNGQMREQQNLFNINCMRVTSL